MSPQDWLGRRNMTKRRARRARTARQGEAETALEPAAAGPVSQPRCLHYPSQGCDYL